jgi:hypothetical protein
MEKIYENYKAVAKSGLGIGNFYSITISNYDIKFQGDNSSTLLRLCQSLGYEFTWDSKMNWLKSQNKEIEIILTSNR